MITIVSSLYFSSRLTRMITICFRIPISIPILCPGSITVVHVSISISRWYCIPI
jgi:hypothetical protein